MNNLYQRLIEYSLRIISKKSYTELEIIKKLDSFCKRRSLDGSTVIEKVIDRLNELKYLDDARFIQNYTNDRINFAPRGKRLIRMELIKRGISKESLEKEFGRIEIDECELAKNLAAKYARKLEGLDKNKFRQRMFGFLGRKGFSPDTIYKVLTRC
ncbi:regulatory protein RecX [Candidatus Gracilibacteria bacterium]|nr:regulatory protein RecX [Candidatus Gracilibacteria bacterium]